MQKSWTTFKFPCFSVFKQDAPVNQYKFIHQESHPQTVTHHHLLCLGVVSEPTHQVEEEERLGAELHAGQPRGAERGGLGERGGGRGVQQAPGPGL